MSVAVARLATVRQRHGLGGDPGLAEPPALGVRLQVEDVGEGRAHAAHHPRRAPRALLSPRVTDGSAGFGGHGKKPLVRRT